MLLAILVLAVAFTSIYAHRYARFRGDLTFELRLQAFRSVPLTQAMKAVSALGDGAGATALSLAAALLFWLKRRRRQSLLIIAAGLLSLAGQGLKLVVDRPRPTSDLVWVEATESSSSFPSGHAVFAMAFFGALFYFAGVYVRNPIWKRAAQAVAAALIVLIGISRVYLGVHWPSAIVGGSLLGGLTMASLEQFHMRARGAAGQRR